MSNNKKKRSITLLLRNYFITGVVVLIPIGFTLYLSKILIGLSSKIIPQNINPNNYLPFAIPGIEIIISILFITIVGGLSLSLLEKDSVICKMAEYIVLKKGILLNKSSINFKIRFPKNDKDRPPTIVIKITEIKISIPGIA